MMPGVYWHSSTMPFDTQREQGFLASHFRLSRLHLSQALDFMDMAPAPEVRRFPAAFSLLRARLLPRCASPVARNCNNAVAPRPVRPLPPPPPPDVAATTAAAAAAAAPPPATAAPTTAAAAAPACLLARVSASVPPGFASTAESPRAPAPPPAPPARPGVAAIAHTQVRRGALTCVLRVCG